MLSEVASSAHGQRQGGMRAWLDFIFAKAIITMNAQGIHVQFQLANNTNLVQSNLHEAYYPWAF